MCFIVWKENSEFCILVQMTFSFLIVHFFLSFLYSTDMSQITCKQSKNNFFHPTVAGTEQLNLIIVCEANISSDDIFLCELFFYYRCHLDVPY